MSQVALITGANRGLGFETARQLGRGGVTVLVGARDTEKGEEAADLLRDGGIHAEALELDVTSRESVRAAAAQVAERYGRLDILVNNAGILPEATAQNRAQPIDLELFHRTFQTNLFGAVCVTQEFLALLRRSPAARIVNVSSTMGSLADQTNPASPYHGLVMPAYQTSKAALNGLTIALSKALAGTTVTVNSVCPGWVQTDLGGPANRAAAPTSAEEAARTVAEMARATNAGSGEFRDAAGTVPW